MAIKTTKASPPQIKPKKMGRPLEDKARVTFYMDQSDLDERRASGKGWQTRMSEDLEVVRRLKKKRLWKKIASEHSG